MIDFEKEGILANQDLIPFAKDVGDVVKHGALAAGNAIAGTVGGGALGLLGMGMGRGVGYASDFTNDRAAATVDHGREAFKALGSLTGDALDQGERLIRGNAAVDSDIKKELDSEFAAATAIEMENQFKEELGKEKVHAHTQMSSQLQKLKENGGSIIDARKMIDKDVEDPASKEALHQAVNQLYGVKKGHQFEIVSSDQIKDVEHKLQNHFDGLNPQEVINNSQKMESNTKLGENAMGRAASTIVRRMETPKNWYENTSFKTGMLRMGLGIMAGEDLTTAFNGATESFQHRHLIDKREQYRQEMIDSGYEPFRVDQWIQQGGAISKPTGSGKTTTWRDSERHGVMGQESSTGEWKPYGDSALKRMGSGGTGGIQSPFSGQGVGDKAGTSDERSKAGRGQLATQGGRSVLSSLGKAEQELADSTFTSKEMYNTVLSSFIQGSTGSMGSSWVQEQLKEEYPQLAQYATVIQQTLNPMLRADSGATLTDPEVQRDVLSYGPRPGDTPEVRKLRMEGMAVRALTLVSSGEDVQAQQANLALQDLQNNKIKSVALTSKGPALQMNDGNWVLMTEAYK